MNNEVPDPIYILIMNYNAHKLPYSFLYYKTTDYNIGNILNGSTLVQNSRNVLQKALTHMDTCQ